MNKTKRALIFMTVIATILCLSLIINIKAIRVPNQNNNSSSSLAASSKEIGTTKAYKDISSIHTLPTLYFLKALPPKSYVGSQKSKLLPSGSFVNGVNSSQVNAESTYADIVTSLPPVLLTNTDRSFAKSIKNTPEKISSSEYSIHILAENDSMQALQPEPKSQYANIGISNAKDFVYLRKTPSTDGEILGKLYRDSAATILDREGDWYYVESGSVTGYIKSEFLTTGLSDDELVANYSTLSICVTVDGLNVREDNSQDAKRLTVIYQNEIFPVIKVDGDWILVKIEDENLQGYILQEYSELIVKFKEAISKEEEEEELQLQAEAKAKEETAIKQNNGVDYASSDLKLLACLVHSEAGTQSYEGKLAVANVVLNRIKSSRYPDTLKAVIYQSGQFSVAASGSLDKQLNKYSNYSSTSQLMSIKAARNALEGSNNIKNRLYFNAYKTALRKGYNDYNSSVKIGDHLFW